MADEKVRTQPPCPWRTAYDYASTWRLTWWRSHEQASTDRYRTEAGLLAEAWGKVALALRDEAAKNGVDVDGG